MTRSLTAYGKSHIKTSGGLFLIEVQSVNRKNLDIQLNLPKELFAIEMKLRKELMSYVKRGSVTVRITREGGGSSIPTLPSKEEMKKVHEEWSKRSADLGYDPKEALPFSLLVQYTLSNNAQGGLDEEVEKELLKGLQEALKGFIQMKTVEGKALAEDMLKWVKCIEKELEKVESLSKEAPKRYKEKLEKRLEELRLNNTEGEERLMRELVIFADRIDITEEMTRLRSHVKQFYTILGKECVGRELDFLTQEMNREINTIASKSQELEITGAALSMKNELGKVREQLQNLE